MKILWLFVVLQTAIAQPGFGRSYLRNSKLCHQWSCLNTKLGLPDSLPTSQEFGSVLRRLLPADWHSIVDNVLDVCYNDRPRRYSNTCPGQAVMHCAVDQLIANCPEANVRKEDACAPINSMAGFNQMFTQSRYENLERNMAFERRPAWFLKNYFNTKCCNLPVLFNSSLLSQCGFTSMMEYYIHNPQFQTNVAIILQKPIVSLDPVNRLNVVTFPPPTTTRHVEPVSVDNGDSLKVVTLPTPIIDTQIDPLECCEMPSFIQPSWRQECNFQLNWEDQHRLVVKQHQISTTESPVTSTARPVGRRDLVVVPQSCEKEACVFSKLNILSSGVVNINSFTKLLDNLTNVDPSWTSAKGRVVTTCLRKPMEDSTCEINDLLACTFDVLTELNILSSGVVNINSFTKLLDNLTNVDPSWTSAKGRVVTTCLRKPMEDSTCEINYLLACTFDVLTENCPNATKDDMCKHTRSDRICQISSSKYRPKNRRNPCVLPELVSREVLRECGLNSLHKVDLVTSAQPKKYQIFTAYKCQELTPSTSCILSKMGVLNQYGFTDYFKMKDHIRHFASNENWPLVNLYLDTFMSGPLYREHCNSAKKFLNVLESMLMTCPASKRKNTDQCKIIFDKISNTPTNSKNLTQDQGERLLKHFHNVFFPTPNIPNKIRPKYTKKLIKKPIYNYGILSDKYAPKVTTIDVKPKVERPLVLLPVYMRYPTNMPGRPFREDGILRSPFWLHDKIAQAHTTPATSQFIFTSK